MKLDWKKVLFCYVCMAIMGASCWVYCTWSFRGLWKGGLVGVGMWTVFLVWMWVEEAESRLVHRRVLQILKIFLGLVRQ